MSNWQTRTYQDITEKDAEYYEMRKIFLDIITYHLKDKSIAETFTRNGEYTVFNLADDLIYASREFKTFTNSTKSNSALRKDLLDKEQL